MTIRPADGVSIPGVSIEISLSGISAIPADPLKVSDTIELEPIAGPAVSSSRPSAVIGADA